MCLLLEPIKDWASLYSKDNHRRGFTTGPHFYSELSHTMTLLSLLNLQKKRMRHYENLFGQFMATLPQRIREMIIYT